MAIAVVDEKGRLTLPKKLNIRDTRIIIIPAGSFLILIPIPPKPSEHATNWLKTNKSRRELKELAEKTALKDAVERTKRRNQL